MNLINQGAEAVNYSVPLLSKLGVGQSVQRFFYKTFYYDQAGRLVFPYQYNGQSKDNEVFGFKTVRLACTNGFWSAGDHHQPSNIFLSFSAMEAIAFAHVNYSKFNGFSRCLFVALGVKPTKPQILFLKRRFKNSNFHTVFSNDLIGKIYDCQASLWLSNKDCTFCLNDNLITVTAIADDKSTQKAVSISRGQFSYFAFHRQFGKRSNLKTHKPSDRQQFSFLSFLALKNDF